MNFFVYVVVFVLALAAFTYFYVPKGARGGTGTAIFILLAAGAFWLSFEAAGQPKPSMIEWRDVSGLSVIGFLKNEKDGVIYYWVLRDGVPVGYTFPWSDNVQSIEDAWRARGQFDGMIMGEDEETAIVRPEPQLPPKE